MPNPFTLPEPLRRAIDALCQAAHALLARAQSPAPATLPAKSPRLNPIATALLWLDALARTLAGETHFLRPIAFPRFPGRYPALTAALRAEIGLPPITHTEAERNAHRAASRLHYLRGIFATVPTSRIATNLARRLGLTPASPDWPHALIAIAEPPAQFARKPSPRAHLPAPNLTQPDTEAAPPPATPFHPRE